MRFTSIFDRITRSVGMTPVGLDHKDTPYGIDRALLGRLLSYPIYETRFIAGGSGPCVAVGDGPDERSLFDHRIVPGSVSGL